MFWIIYIIGFLISYIIIKIIRNKNNKTSTWEDVAWSFGISIFSFVGILFTLGMLFLNYIEDKKPPKWL